MTKEEYQLYVELGASKKYTKELALIGLCEEVGELAGVIKKDGIYNDMSYFINKYGMTVNDKIKDEAGDVLWQLVNVLNIYGVTLEELMGYNVNKLNERHGGSGRTSENGGKR